MVSHRPVELAQLTGFEPGSICPVCALVSTDGVRHCVCSHRNTQLLVRSLSVPHTEYSRCQASLTYIFAMRPGRATHMLMPSKAKPSGGPPVAKVPTCAPS